MSTERRERLAGLCASWSEHAARVRLLEEIRVGLEEKGDVARLLADELRTLESIETALRETIHEKQGP